jgi:hypothetical protein
MLGISASFEAVVVRPPVRGSNQLIGNRDQEPAQVADVPHNLAMLRRHVVDERLVRFERPARAMSSVLAVIGISFL